MQKNNKLITGGRGNMTIQLGFDIATSLSIIIAMISYIATQNKERKQSRARYAVDNLKGMLTYVKNASVKYYDMTKKLRRKGIELAQEQFSQKQLIELEHEYQANNLEIIMLLEDIERELEAQKDIYFSVFFPGGIMPNNIVICINNICNLIEPMRSNNKKVILETMPKIELGIKEIEKAVAKELKTLIESSYKNCLKNYVLYKLLRKKSL